jgi:Lon protease-like protein
MPDRVVRDFPLFPLRIVALPHELVPLHIFEERYRTMIGECLEQEKEFGIVWAGEDGVRPVGCAMEIAEVLERTEDGRMNILTRGTRPFRILDESHDLPYPSGTVEFLADKDERADAKQGLLDLRSENARLRLVTRLFRAASRRLEFIERAQERARSNGKVRFS